MFTVIASLEPSKVSNCGPELEFYSIISENAVDCEPHSHMHEEVYHHLIVQQPMTILLFNSLDLAFPRCLVAEEEGANYGRTKVEILRCGYRIFWLANVLVVSFCMLRPKVGIRAQEECN